MFLGTLINAATIFFGGVLGALFHQFIPKKIQFVAFQAIGLFTLLVGTQMALKATSILPILFSLLLGGITGEVLDLDQKLERFALFLKSRFKSHDSRFIDGFITNTMFSCIGAFAIMGPINEVLKGDRTLLITKAVADGLVAIAYAAGLGIGVAFSAISIIIYQGLITIFASFLQNILTPSVMNQLTSVGGLLIIGIGISILEIKKIKVTHFLPSLVYIVLISLLMK